MPNLKNNDPTSTRSDLLARPIILIGAGRSGSTLFTRFMDEHPRVRFFGETHFLLPRLWREIWESKERRWLNLLNFPSYFSSNPELTGPPHQPANRMLDTETLERERERIADLIRQLFGDILRVQTNIGAWGYKEIWNGNDAVARFSWDIYDAVFPEATWVHLVRDPFDFLISIARWNRKPLTEDLIRNELSHWVQMFEWSRQRRSQRRFIEIRYEDLILDPKKSLHPIFSAAGVG